MDIPIFKIIFLIGLVSSFAIRAPFRREIKQNIITDNRKTTQENSLLSLVFLGMVVVPLLYVFTSWLNVANYPLPIWAGALGSPE
ncbi:MAG: hypothetical protein F6K09_13430 [Merismopedia sp. SIO2A8]|nr:hypothetical protein [Merismopedia sp. SIO2A8]